MIRPEINLDETVEIISNLFGLKVNTISQLNGYDDKNFHIFVDPEVNNNNFIKDIVDDGYVVKVVNSLDSQYDEWFKAQHELLLALNKNNIACSKPILTKNGKPFEKVQLSSGNHIVRLFEFISGEILFKIQGTSKLFYDVGVLTAKLDNVFQELDQPAFHRNFQWTMSNAPDILNYLDAVQNKEREEIVKNVIEEFNLRVLSIEEMLDKGLIHGDINEQNLLVEQINNHFSLKAVLDFGDTHYTCYLYELAIAMTYMIITSNQIGTGGYVLAGYRSVRTISDQELDLLRICVLTRMCQSLVLGAHASLQQSDNSYQLITAKHGWALLETMFKIPEKDLLERWASVKFAV